MYNIEEGVLSRKSIKEVTGFPKYFVLMGTFSIVLLWVCLMFFVGVGGNQQKYGENKREL